MLDISIIAGYLLLTLVVGICKGWTTKDMRDYSIAGRRYSNTILVATILATLIGGGSTLGATAKVYTVGITYLFVGLGGPINKLITAHYIAPRMARFYNMISVGDIMNSLYGKPGRVITGLAGTLLCIGMVGAQVMALGYLFHFFFGMPHMWGVLIGAGIVVIYTAFGGIRAVTATDSIQFGILIVAIPMVSTVAFHEVGGLPALIAALPADHLTIFPNKAVTLQYLPVFLMFCIPYLNPAIIQRFLMAKNTRQIATSMRFAALLQVPLKMVIGIIALSALALYPNINPNLALPHLMNHILPAGIKGFAIAGMLAVIMSTADSYLNAGSITFVHDFVAPLSKKALSDAQELRLARVMGGIMGLFSIVAAISFHNIIDIVLFFNNFWGPIVVVPLIAGILGFRSNVNSFITGALVGSITVVTWIFFIRTLAGVDSQIPGLIASGLGFFGAHYFQGLHRKPPTDGFKKLEKIEQFASA